MGFGKNALRVGDSGFDSLTDRLHIRTIILRPKEALTRPSRQLSQYSGRGGVGGRRVRCGGEKIY